MDTDTRATCRRSRRASSGARPRSGEVAGLLRAHRLVTLTGVGGVGKTRLALQVAAGLVGGVPRRGLAGRAGPGRRPTAPCRTRWPASWASRPQARLGAGRHDRPHAHRASAADRGGQLRAPARRRRRPGRDRSLPGRRRSRCWQPRGGPAGRRRAGVAGPLARYSTRGPGSAAVELFVERARSVNPAFELGDPTATEAVIEICRRLDGIALAIELARHAWRRWAPRTSGTA